jgi:hypothetical protein
METEIAAQSVRIWGLRGTIFRHVQAVRSWETPRGQAEANHMRAVVGWFEALQERQIDENETLLQLVQARDVS